ncbi:MAG: flagellin hook IN motif-containing protein, partial [Gaiellales bacterium]
MSRINTNVPSMIAQRVLGQNNLSLTTSLERLSTGFRINRGKDDPAGLIVSQNLRAELSAVGQAIDNAERADQVVNIAEGGLTEISGLLNELQALITQTANDAGLSGEEKEANQLQIDSVLQTIDRVASATSFQGFRLLNGNLDYVTDTVNANVHAFKVNGAKLDVNDVRNVEVVVTGSAQVAGFFLSFGGATLNLGGASPSDGVNSTFVFEVSGSKGAREFSFASGTSLVDITNAVNSFTDVTGVQATVSGTGLNLSSAAMGTDELVTVRVIDNGILNTAVAQAGVYNLEPSNTNAALTTGQTLFTNASDKITDKGQDVSATINGIRATTSGTIARINTDFLDVEIDLEVGT